MFTNRVILRSLFFAIVVTLIWTSVANGQQSLRIAESGDYAEIPHDPSLTPSEITIEVWIRVHALGDTSMAGAGGEQSVLDKRGSEGGYQFRLAGDAFPLGAGVLAEPTLTFHINLVEAYRWHHMAMTQDADSISFYFDGTLMERLGNTYSSGSTSGLFLGDLSGCVSGCLWLRGEIDDLRIWNHARTQAQVIDSMNVKLSGDETGLVAYWDFDDANGTTISDRTANGNHGTLFGNAALVASDAPVGFLPLAEPTGLRAHAEGASVRVLWKRATTPETGAYNIYRADTSLVPITPDHLLATVLATDSTYIDATAILDQTHYYAIAAVDTGGHVGSPSREIPGRATEILEDYLVGTLYFHRYGADAEAWTDTYMRSFLTPQQTPWLGHYNSADPAIVDQHLDWMSEYGVDFLAGYWPGQASREDSVLKDVVGPALLGRPNAFTIYYDILQLGDPGNIESTQEAQLVSDFTYIAQTYFDHPNFLRFQDRPVLFIHRTRFLGGAFEQAFETVRTALLQLGHNVYLVGDEVGHNLTPDIGHMQFLDGLGMYRGVSRPPRGGYPVDGDPFGTLARRVAAWRTAAMAEGKGFIPSVTPGANHRAVNPDHWIIPRQIDPGACETSFFEEATLTLRSYAGPQWKAILVSDWNGWTTDTQVEPSIITAPSSTDVSGTNAYSGGYAYTGYGTAFLELIQSLLGFDPGQVVLQTPLDGAVGQPRRGSLVWTPIAEAGTYHVQVAEDSDFLSLVADAAYLSGTSMETDTLAANTVFHWRVRAQSNGGSGAWSVPFNFTTGTLVPVRLGYLKAKREDEGGVTVFWRILDGESQGGFHVYRATEKPILDGGGKDKSDAGRVGDDRLRLTDRLLTGKTEYSFTDREAPLQAVEYWVNEVGRTGGESWYGPVRVSSAQPPTLALQLDQNRPNPIRSTTTLVFTIPTATHATLQILDLGGRIVAQPFHRHCPPGRQEASWDGKDAAGRALPNGIYFYRLVTGVGARAAKLVLLR